MGNLQTGRQSPDTTFGTNCLADSPRRQVTELAALASCRCWELVGLSRCTTLARFSNNGGLVDQGGGYFGVGPNSGEPLVGKPLDFGNGRLLGGSLELSNVDLSQEFIDMILAQTGFGNR